MKRLLFIPVIFLLLGCVKNDKNLPEGFQNDEIIFDTGGLLTGDIAPIIIGATITEYKRRFSYLEESLSFPEILYDRKNTSYSIDLSYHFYESTGKITGILLSNYSSSAQDWYNSRLAKFIAEGDDIQQVGINDYAMIINNTPVVNTKMYTVFQSLEIDGVGSNLHWVIIYKD